MGAFASKHSSRLQRQQRVRSTLLAVSASASFVPLCALAGEPSRDGGPLEEVIVSALRRDQRLQDVPVSITVVGGDRLEQSSLEGVTESLTLVPGVKIAPNFQGGGTQISMRGVSASAPSAAGSGTVGYYIDSVPFGLVRSAVVPDANVYDLKRIEVLRGPQGTLYGANALNGVVRILTNDADLNRFAFKARTTISSTEGGGESSYRGDAALNIPLVQDRLAARVVAGYNQLGGWIDDPNRKDVNDGQVRNARVRLDAQPTDNLSLGLSAWTSRSELDAPNISDDSGRIPSLIDQPLHTDFDAFGMTVAYDFPLFTLTSMTSYIEYLNDSRIDLRPFNIPTELFTFTESEVRSEELILSSNQDGSWRWSIGGFYRDAQDIGYQTASFLVRTDGIETSESFAAFGELTRLFADGKFEVTAGLRYFEDEVRLREVRLGPPAVELIDATSTFDTLSPRFVLNWHPSSDVTVYGSYAEGFRSGFEQGSLVRTSAPSFPPVEEDTLRTYELGARSTFATALTLDAAVYYIDWQDIQQVLTVDFFEPTAGRAIPIPAPINAGSASGLGVDFAVTLRPLEGLSLGASLGWNDLTFDHDVISAGLVLFEAGERLNYSAEYTAGTEIVYDIPIGTGGYRARFSASGNYSSEQTFRTVTGGLRRFSTGDEILIVRSSLTIDAPGGWSLMLFGDNLNDEDGAMVRPSATVNYRNTHPRPRTYGLQLEYRY